MYGRFIFCAVVSLCVFVFAASGVWAQEKVQVGIGKIESGVYGANPDNFQTMLETQLIKTNKFTIIERSRIDEILKEQGLSSTEFVDGGAQFGGIKGIDYLIYGSITKLGSDKGGVSIGGFSAGGGNAAMSIDLRIVDAHTGEIILADTVERSLKTSGNVRIQGFSKSDSSGDPLSDIQRVTAEAITGLVVTTIYPVKLIAIQGDGTVILNYGKGLFDVGDAVNVYEMGEGFVDPDTGEVLGKEETLLGVLEVVEVQAKYAKAKAVEGSGFAKGNIARKAIPSKDPKKKKRKFLNF